MPDHMLEASARPDEGPWSALESARIHSQTIGANINNAMARKRFVQVFGGGLIAPGFFGRKKLLRS